ncbi:ParB/RepB/Spo0J family partition protein [Janibacter cremeus]|uniref:ParB/RepB/Spo0J family partition protein n=1 Tax=Janibacter cremeus TaxID=1285192 RepID=UPI0023F64F7D|nr:ParB/RepB/Spo0J family partition protein [Janibacter cremeus]WEV77379.1 ParB/RepB/Spo0J family partition protein [Janibacter cremeus]
MSEKRRGLGRGLGALIPDSTAAGRPVTERPVDVWFRDQERPAVPHTAAGMLAETPVGDSAGEGDEVPTPDVDVAARSDGADVSEGAREADEPVEAQDEAGLAPVPGATYGEVPVAAIRANPRQPRTVFDEDDMAELVQSIEQIGVLQPIVVRRVEPEDGVEFELIMGERRWRASREADRETIPAIVRTTDDEDLLRDALLENLHRSNLNPLEEAAAYRQLLDDFGCSQEELSKRIGRSRPQISNTLRLLRLPPVVARRVAAGVLSAGHARALLTLEDGSQMEHLAQRIVAEGLSVRTVEEIVALGVEPESPARSTSRAGQERDAQLDDLAGRISDRLDTRVKIDLGKRKGRMTIEFASREDLHRVLGQMGVDATED